MIEEWKDIKGYEGLYKISNHGRIKSNKHYNKNKILKPIIKNRRYQEISLTKNNKKKSVKIHRLVALHFILNPDNKSQVNHKDGNKQNNHISNLEWVTASENMKHAYCNNLTKDSINKAINKLKIKCRIYNDNFDKTFDSCNDASRYLNVYCSAITQAYKNKGKCKGYYVDYIK